MKLLTAMVFFVSTTGFAQMSPQNYQNYRDVSSALDRQMGDLNQQLQSFTNGEMSPDFSYPGSYSQNLNPYAPGSFYQMPQQTFGVPTDYLSANFSPFEPGASSMGLYASPGLCMNGCNQIPQLSWDARAGMQ